MATKERKINATVEEAVANAGTRTLSRIGGTPSVHPTVKEVEEYEKDHPKEIIAYGGPYTDPEDERNSWTAKQDIDAIPPVVPLTQGSKK